MSQLLINLDNFKINRIQITKNKTIEASGMCCLSISNDATLLKNLVLLFSKTHLYSNNDIKIEGNVLYNNKTLSASKLHFLLNPHVILNSNDSVTECLSSINSEECDKIMKNLEINFCTKNIGKLTVNESRLFEVALNLAIKPPIIYLSSIEIEKKQKECCLRHLKEYTKQNGGVVIIECEYTSIFDSAIIIKREDIVSLDKDEARRYFMDNELSVFNIQNSTENSATNYQKKKEYKDMNNERCNAENTENSNEFDYSHFYKKYGTNTLIDLKQKQLSLIERLFNANFYKINLTQALKSGLKRYEMAFHKTEQRLTICKSIAPCLFFIFFLRFIQLLSDYTLLSEIPDFLSCLIFLFVDLQNFYLKITFSFLYFIKFFLIRELTFSRLGYLIKHLLRSEIECNGYKLIFACVCFSIIYNYSSIFEEECQSLNHHMNILITPGTYVMSIFIYIFLAHFTTYITIGLLFNVRLLPHAVISASFTNLIYLSFTGRRLRSAMIGSLLAVFLLGMVTSQLKYEISVLKYLYFIVFPCVDRIEFDNTHPTASYPSYISFPFHFYIYAFASYIICCCILSYK